MLRYWSPLSVSLHTWLGTSFISLTQDEEVVEAMEGFFEEHGGAGNQSVRAMAKLLDSEQVRGVSFELWLFLAEAIPPPTHTHTHTQLKEVMSNVRQYIEVERAQGKQKEIMPSLFWLILLSTLYPMQFLAR